ncbi:MAG: hypothetical protein V9E83_09960 [Baekduia sp.]
MAKRRRDSPQAPATDYPSPDGEMTLRVRGVMTVKTREQYRHEASPAGTTAAANTDDIRERAIEFLFERLVAGWTISGVETKKPKELLLRYRFASREEREWITGVIREHCAEWFPDIVVP